VGACALLERTVEHLLRQPGIFRNMQVFNDNFPCHQRTAVSATISVSIRDSYIRYVPMNLLYSLLTV